MLTLVQQLVGVHSPVVAANLWRGGDVLLAVAPDNGMAAWQKVSFLMGMLILIYTVVKMGVRRRMVLANHANRGSRGDSSPGADHSPGRSGLSGWFGLGSLRGGSPAITPVGGERHRTLTPRRELESLVVNLRETGREIEARLDTKIRFAQRLLQEAEETLTQLELARARTEAVARSEGGVSENWERESEEPVPTTSLSGGIQSQLPASLSGKSTRDSIFGSAEEREDAEHRFSSQHIDEMTDRTVPRPAANPDPFHRLKESSPPEQSSIAIESEAIDTVSLSDGDQEWKAQVRAQQLASIGRTPVEIAQELQRPVGEIELILALGKGSGRSLDDPPKSP